MNRMNRKDRVILEELQSKYGMDALATAIMNVQNAMAPEAVSDGVQQAQMSPAEIVLEYIKRIEGYRIRLREIHWMSDHRSTHELADSLMYDLASYEDSIAEDMMGIIGYRIKVGTIIPKLPKATELKALINEIVNDTICVKQNIEEFPVWTGICNILDECVHMLNKSQYLSDFK